MKPSKNLQCERHRVTKSLESRRDCCRQRLHISSYADYLYLCSRKYANVFSVSRCFNSLLCPRKRAYRCCGHVLPWAGLELSYYFKNSSGKACYADYSRPSLFQVFRSWGQRKEMGAEKKKQRGGRVEVRVRESFRYTGFWYTL